MGEFRTRFLTLNANVLKKSSLKTKKQILSFEKAALEKYIAN